MSKIFFEIGQNNNYLGGGEIWPPEGYRVKVYSIILILQVPQLTLFLIGVGYNSQPSSKLVAKPIQ